MSSTYYASLVYIIVVNVADNMTNVCAGAGHGCEFLFLFGPSMMQQAVGRRFTPTEERLSVIMKRLWAQFIRQG